MKKKICKVQKYPVSTLKTAVCYYANVDQWTGKQVQCIKMPKHQKGLGKDF